MCSWHLHVGSLRFPRFRGHWTARFSGGILVTAPVLDEEEISEGQVPPTRVVSPLKYSGISRRARVKFQSKVRSRSRLSVPQKDSIRAFFLDSQTDPMEGRPPTFRPRAHALDPGRPNESGDVRSLAPGSRALGTLRGPGGSSRFPDSTHGSPGSPSRVPRSPRSASRIDASASTDLPGPHDTYPI